ncbi:MAG: MJ0042-type zinc finger domain-containing protein [Planctomycetaceae bacterium]
MADPISVQCPHCKAKLKLKAAPPDGKKVGCPKCKKPFPVKAPPKKKADEDDFGDLLDEVSEDDYEAPDDDEANDEDEDERLARSTTRSRGSGSKSSGSKSGVSKKGAAKGKKGRGKKSSAGPLLAIIGGSVAALLLLGGLGWLLMNLLGSKGIRSASGEFIALMPADADVYFTARPADLIASPVLASLFQKPDGQKGLAEFEKSFGFPAQEVEHFFMAMKMDPNAANAAQPGAPPAGNPMMAMPGMPGGMGMGMPGTNQAGLEDGVVILTLKQPFGGKTLAQLTQGLTAKSHNGIDYFVNTIPNGSAIIFGNDKHVILTEPKWIERTIDRQDLAENNGVLAYLAKDQHLTIVANPRSTATQPAMPPGFSPSMLPNQEMQKLVQEIASVRIDVKLPGSADLKVELTCKTDSAAQQFFAETAKQLEQRKQQASFLKMMLPDIDSVITSVQINRAGSTMTVSLSVPGQMIDKLKQQSGTPGGSAPGFSPGSAFPGVATPGAPPQNFPPGFPAGAAPPGTVPPAGAIPPGAPRP